MADDEIDFSDVTLDIDFSGMAQAMLPHLVQLLSTNPTLRNALIQAIMPTVQTQMLQLARSTSGTGTVTGRTPGQ